MERIYFDNSATTVVSKEAASAMCRAACEIYGNPSSLHLLGQQAEKLVSDARDSILKALGAPHGGLFDRQSLIFTSGGTEANNLAILGTAHAKSRNRNKRLIVSDSEHPSVLECAKQLQKEGFDVYYLSTKDGVLHRDDIEKALEKEVFLCSCMIVNNETGARYDVESLFRQVKRKYPQAVTHADAVQAFLHVDFRVSTLGADLITVSSHKIHGPMGCGCLYASPAVLQAKALSPIMLGGGQEQGLRSGTENVPGIAGFGVAASHIPDHASQRQIREFILSHLPEGVTANLPSGTVAPHILSLSLPDIRSETMLHFLDSKGISVSSGSACASNTGHGSYVLTAFGLSEAKADSTIRISTDESVTKEQAEYFLIALGEGCQSLVRRNRT